MPIVVFHNEPILVVAYMRVAIWLIFDIGEEARSTSIYSLDLFSIISETSFSSNTLKNLTITRSF